MRRWGLPPAVGRFPGDPRPLRGHAEVFLPPHHLRWGGSLASPAGWEGMRKHSSSHSPAHRVKVSSESVPPGTPKLFAFRFSLFTILFFRPKPGEGEKQRHTHLIFRGPRELLPARAILSHLYAVCGHPESGLFELNPFGTVFNPNGTIHRSPVDFRPSLT